MDFKITHSIPFKVSRPPRPTPAPLVRLWEARCVCALVTAQPKLQESSGFQAGEASMTITEMTSVGRLVGARWGGGTGPPWRGPRALVSRLGPDTTSAFHDRSHGLTSVDIL